MAGQAHAQLAGGVVDHPLVGALPIQVRVVPASDGAGVVGASINTCGPGQLVRAVVQLADDERAVDVAVDEIDQHLGARARGEKRAPVGARHALRHAHPGAAGGVAGGVAGGRTRRGARGVERTGLRALATLPRELDAHAAIAVGVNGVFTLGHDPGGLRAWCGRGFEVRGQGQQAQGGRGGAQAVAVAALLDVGGAQDLGGLGAQVVGHLVGDGDGGEAAVGTCTVPVVVEQLEGGAWVQGAHGACGINALLLQGERVEQVLRATLGFGGAGVQRVGHAAVGVQALAVALVELQRGHGGGQARGLGLGGNASELALVPRGQGDGVGADGLRGGPLCERVLREATEQVAGELTQQRARRAMTAGLAEAQTAQVRAFGGLVEDDELGAGVGRSGVVQAPAPALGGHQATGKSPVGFAMLGGDGAQRTCFGHFQPEGQLRPGLQHLRDDVRGGEVLEDAGVSAQGQPAAAVAHGEAVAAQAAVAAQLRGRSHPALPGAPAAIGLQQAQGHARAHERLEGQARLGADAIDFGMQGLGRVQAFGERGALDEQG